MTGKVFDASERYAAVVCCGEGETIDVAVVVPMQHKELPAVAVQLHVGAEVEKHGVRTQRSGGAGEGDLLPVSTTEDVPFGTPLQGHEIRHRPSRAQPHVAGGDRRVVATPAQLE